jgi:hypothetical protein
MSRMTLVLLAMVVVGASRVGAEGPPYQRLLQGEDARKVAALQQRITELWAAGKFADAVAPAEAVLALRKQVQGDGHWEVADAARVVESLRKGAALPAPKRGALAEAPGITAKARELYQRGKYAEAEPLYRQALASYEETLGPKHPYTADSCNSLAANLAAQGGRKRPNCSTGGRWRSGKRCWDLNTQARPFARATWHSTSRPRGGLKRPSRSCARR